MATMTHDRATHDDPPTRTLTTRKGKAVETPYTDAEAMRILKVLPGPSNFARNLLQAARRRGLSRDQWTWVHVMAVAVTRNIPE